MENKKVNGNLVKEAVNRIGNLLKLAYGFALGTDILMMEINHRTAAFGGLKQDKKRAYSNFRKAVESAAYWYGEAFDEDLIKAAEENAGKLDGYRQDANELVRVAMLYIDRTTTQEMYENVMKYLHDMPEGGIFSDKEIGKFDFTANSRKL